MKNVGIDVAVLWVLRDGVQVLRNAKKVSNRYCPRLFITQSFNQITTGFTTKEGEKCADRCGCEYPKGWSSGHKQCRTGDKTWDHKKCPDRCGCNMGIEGWSSSDKKCKEGE